MSLPWESLLVRLSFGIVSAIRGITYASLQIQADTPGCFLTNNAYRRDQK
jgi:hypothetical protein